MSELSTSDITIGSHYSFEVYPTAILGNQFKNVKALAVVDAQTARMFGVDIESLHANVYPTLPQGAPDDPYYYSYLYVEQLNGTRTVVGFPWIRQSSLVVSTNQRVTMIFEDKSPKDIKRIQEALSAIGMVPSVTQMSND